MQSTLSTSCSKSLIQEMPGQIDIYLSHLIFYRQVIFVHIRNRNLKHEIIELAQSLTCSSEGFHCIWNTLIQVCLTISDKPYRLSVDGSVAVETNGIAVIYPADFFYAKRLHSICGKFNKTVLYSLEISFLLRCNNFIWFRNIKLIVPKLIQSQPEIGSFLIDESGLPVCSVVAYILKRCGDDSVKEKRAFLQAF